MTSKNTRETKADLLQKNEILKGANDELVRRVKVLKRDRERLARALVKTSILRIQFHRAHRFRFISWTIFRLRFLLRGDRRPNKETMHL